MNILLLEKNLHKDFTYSNKIRILVAQDIQLNDYYNQGTFVSNYS